MRNPQNREDSIRPIVEAAGGRIESFYYSFGDYDAVIIVDMPNNVSVAALSMAASNGGSISTLKTTPLITMDEAVEAMRQAGQVSYLPPSA